MRSLFHMALLILMPCLLVECAGPSSSGQATSIVQQPTNTPTYGPTNVSALPMPSVETLRRSVSTATSLPTRTILYGPTDVSALPTIAPTPAPSPAWSYPIGRPGQPLGDGFFVRHGYETENTWYNPGYWHTGEDWYAVNNGETAGAHVYAVAGGTVVYAGSNYPGRVVIVQHAGGLFSMYGHLDFNLLVQNGAQVARGQPLGAVLKRSDDVPSHLHFEIRTFLTADAVNGPHPRYGFRCGPNCPPGPGYWPIRAPDLPSDLGWRMPTHVINGRMFAPEAQAPLGQVVVTTRPVSASVMLWSAPGDSSAQMLEQLALQPGARFPLLGVHVGPEDQRETSAAGYELWYRIGLPDGRDGWVQAAVPSTFETGSDERPSSVYFNMVPAVSAISSAP
jgi:murein DD-endopeptidase MepM/ murein hydrolase activator NlpD